MRPNETEYKIYQVNAFTDTLFKGNPACVVPLKEWLSDELLLKIAKGNAVAETAYFIDHKDYFHLRWFTPDIEMDLCGHATLAAAHIIKSELNSTDEMKFKFCELNEIQLIEIYDKDVLNTLLFKKFDVSL